MWLPTLITLLINNSIPEETAASLREALPQTQISQEANKITIQGSSDEIIQAKTLFYQLDRPLDQILFKFGFTTPDQLVDHPSLQLSLASCRDGRSVLAELQSHFLEFQPKLAPDGHNIQVHLTIDHSQEVDVSLGDGRSLAIQGLTGKGSVLVLSAEVL